MTPAEYRAKAEELSAVARLATNPAMRVECEKLAQRYLRLGEQADWNIHTDAYETPAGARHGFVAQRKQREE